MGYSQDEWTPLIIHEKMTGNRDAQSHAQIKIIANKAPPGLLLVGGTRCFGSWRHPLFRASHGLMLVGGGGVQTLPFCLGTAYNVCSMEDIEISRLLC